MFEGIKKYLLLIFLFVITHNAFCQNCRCDYTIPLNATLFDGNAAGVQPGDIVCIESGIRPYLRITNVNGNEANPVIIQNCDGAAIIHNLNHYYAFAIDNSTYFRLTGTGDSTITYGIKITASTTAGLSPGNRTSDFEIDHLEISGTHFAGILSKTDPVCDGSVNRGNFVQKNIRIHHNYIHDTGGEGLYIGHTWYHGYVTTCDGITDTLYPHEIHNIKIFNNKVVNSGWDGIQVGCATQGCEIFNNEIINYGSAEVYAHMSGIQIGSGTSGKCYNNIIKDGKGNGIYAGPLGDNWIFNNLIIRPGKSYAPTNSAIERVYGIFCDDRHVIAGSSINLINNTIIDPKSDGIRFYNGKSKNNLILNNLIINPGSIDEYLNDNTARTDSDAYIYMLNEEESAIIMGNYFARDSTEVQFTNPLSGNYRIKPSSPAIDAGVSVFEYGIDEDFAGNQRLAGRSTDAGAFEQPTPGNSSITHCNCDFFIDRNTVVFNGNDVRPGDTICIQAGIRPELNLRNIHGDSLKPVVIINHRGEVTLRAPRSHYGILTENCSNFILSGNGDPRFGYGISIDSIQGAGIRLTGLTTAFTLQNIEIAHAKNGIVSGTSPDCNLQTNRDHFTQKNTIFKNLFIHDIQATGILAGDPRVNGIAPQCDDLPKGVRKLLPHEIYNLTIESCRFQQVKGNNIWVNNASRNCRISNNELTNSGIPAAIFIGKKSSCDCSANRILNHRGHGILTQSKESLNITNNLLVGNDNPVNSEKFYHAIYITSKGACSNAQLIANNTMVKPNGTGIFIPDFDRCSRYIHNNLIVKPGALNVLDHYGLQESEAYIFIKNQTNSVISHNQFIPALSLAGFVDTLEGDYRLVENSPAVESGIDLSQFGVSQDISGNKRPFWINYDAGAYENMRLDTASRCGCDHFILRNSSYWDGIANQVKPGDTICIKGGMRNQLRLTNITGDSANYVIIKNYRGKVQISGTGNYYGISIDNSRYFRLIGIPDSINQYGIQIDNITGNGLVVSGKSSDFEISNLEIAHTSAAGINFRINPDCNYTAVRDSFTGKNILLHDNYIHHTGTEGIHAGHPAYAGVSLACNGITQTLFPAILHQVAIYNNKIDSTGKDAIRLNSTTGGKIFNNNINAPFQDAGITVGGGTSAEVYNNIIKGGNGHGILVMGQGLSKIFNNLVINAGRDNQLSGSSQNNYGIFCKDYTIPYTATYYIINNTIINPEHEAIKFNSLNSMANKIINNLLIDEDVMNPLDLSRYVNIINLADVNVANNYIDNDFEEVNMLAPEQDIYIPGYTSPVIDAGTDVVDEGISFDLTNLPRPMGEAIDLGAYEVPNTHRYGTEAIPVNQTEKQIELPGFSIYPNPSKPYRMIYIKLNIPEEGLFTLNVFNTTGQLVENILSRHHYQKGEYRLQWDARFNTPGTYFVSLSNKNIKIIEKVIIAE